MYKMRATAWYFVFIIVACIKLNMLPTAPVVVQWTLILKDFAMHLVRMYQSIKVFHSFTITF